MSEAEGVVEPHAAVPRRPGHGGLGVVVKAETEGVGVSLEAPTKSKSYQYNAKWDSAVAQFSCLSGP